MSKEAFSLIDENGKLKPKDEVLQAVEEMYEEAAHTCECGSENYFDMVTDHEGQVDVDEVLNSHDFYSRTIYITDTICDETANKVNRLINFYNKIDELDKLDINDRIPIRIFINSNGGDLDAGFSIISTIINSLTPIHTYNIGKAWSCAFFILVCGDKRYGVPYSSYLFHEGSIITGGDAHKFIQQSKFYEYQLKELKRIVLDNTLITEEYYEKHRPDDLWFMTDGALKLGIIDGILESYSPLTVRKEEN